MPAERPPVPPAPILVGGREAARLLGIGQRTLHGLAVRGDVPSVRLGRRRLFAPAMLAEWAAARVRGEVRP